MLWRLVAPLVRGEGRTAPGLGGARATAFCLWRPDISRGAASQAAAGEGGASSLASPPGLGGESAPPGPPAGAAGPEAAAATPAEGPASGGTPHSPSDQASSSSSSPPSASSAASSPVVGTKPPRSGGIMSYAQYHEIRRLTRTLGVEAPPGPWNYDVAFGIVRGEGEGRGGKHARQAALRVPAPPAVQGRDPPRRPAPPSSPLASGRPPPRPSASSWHQHPPPLSAFIRSPRNEEDA